MKELVRKVYPIVLPPLCIIAGILGIIFFSVGPVGKGQYDILALGVIALVAAVIQIVLIAIEFFKERKDRK